MTTRIEQLKTLIKNKEQAINHVRSKMNNFEYESTEEEYDEFLDEIYDEVVLGTLTYSPSQVLKDVDPTAYRCGKIEYDNGKELTDVEEYTDLQNELEEMENELEDLENELEELQGEEE